ncbi:L,D-transpeptidase [Corynebacterium sp. NPDC060344]|uniref:L,D-transpeptidase n=1 Tax=Corynebacterium sp. NPDC060344 TaxID=3347101 RepID=UPI0036508C80
MHDSPTPRRDDRLSFDGGSSSSHRPTNRPTGDATERRARSHRATGGDRQWRVQVNPERAGGSGGRRHRRKAPASAQATGPKRPLIAAAVAVLGVLTLGVVASLAMNEPRDTDEVLTADQTTQVAPEPLAAEVRGEMIQRHLEGVPVPFPRNVEIHDRVGAAKPMNEADVIETVNATLHEWNLTPDGALVENACPPHARACVDVDNRLAWLQENGEVSRGPVPITTGRPGYETPRGEHVVQRKVRDEISYVFDNEPMPYSVYFTTTGVAFHEGDLTEDSHGCIHLSNLEAVHYFEVLQPNDIVVTF